MRDPSSSALDDGLLVASRRSRPLSIGSRSVGGQRAASGSRRHTSLADSDQLTETSAHRASQRGRSTIEKQAPRAIRPSSLVTTSTRSQRSTASIAKGDIGCTPWQPCIEGGSHSSYSEICRPQTRPELTVPTEKATHGRKVFMSGIQDLISSSTLTPGQSTIDPGIRQFTLCPNMRSRGFCRLPSCPYIHEVCRPRKQHQPLYNANAKKDCSGVPCRFLVVLGYCPYADSCVYSHAESKPSTTGGASGAATAATAAGESCTSSAVDAMFESKMAFSRQCSWFSDDSESSSHANKTQPRPLFGGA